MLENAIIESKSALVVDAGYQLSHLLARILDPAGWRIQDVADNVMALKFVEAARFDLIVTAAKTSGKEDVAMLRKIRSVRPHTRFVILTDEATPGDVLEAMREGAFSVFSKPVSLPSLASIVKSATEEPCWDDGIEIVSATPDWIRLMARCDMRTADRLVQFFYEMIPLPQVEKESVSSAFREMLMNAIEHGGRFDPEKYVEISYLRTRRSVACRIKDPGKGFSLDDVPHSAIMNPPDNPLHHMAIRDAKNLRPGGYGVLLARNSVDELFYNEEGNEVVLIKYLDKAA